MAARTSYLLRLSGRMRGDFNTVEAIIASSRIFDGPTQQTARVAPTGSPLPYGDPWPNGFVFPHYIICNWNRRLERHAYRANGRQVEEIVFGMRAETHSTRDGTLYTAQKQILPEVEWFYAYRDYTWHPDLIAKLQALNAAIRPKVEELIAPIWFSEYQIYCGNGGW